MTNKLIKPFITLCVTLFLASCGNHQAPPQTASYFFNNDTVYIDTQSSLFARLSFVTTSEQSFSRQIEAPATITFNPTKLAHVIVPFSGRVTRSHTRIGQTVNVGTPLFEIVSADFIEAQKEFFQAKSERELASTNLRRQQELQKNGVASQRDLEEAQNEFALAESALHNATEIVRIFHLNPANMTVGEPLIIRSPIAGEVIENNVVLGQFLSEEEDAVTIANLQKMWVEAHIAERDIRYVNNESIIEFRTTAFPDQLLSAQIFHISNRIDEDTRMINVLAEADNQDKQLKDGMFATVIITAQPQPRIIIPETAVMQGGRQNFVFVRTGENAFVRRYVDVEIITNGKAVIASGLQEDEVVIGGGGVYLVF